MMDTQIIKTFALTEKQMDMLEELSEKESRSKSMIVRRAIEYYYENSKRDEQ